MGSSSSSSQAQVDAPFEVLCALFDSATGAVNLGRILNGSERGRAAVLREVDPSLLPRLGPSIGAARALSHPSISKFLGVLKHGESAYIASEYVQGVSLFELMRAAKESKVRVPYPVAIRIVHDALIVAEQLGQMSDNSGAERYLFPDTIWVADYGATLLSEPGVVYQLRQASGVKGNLERESGDSSKRASGKRTLATDAQTASVLLFQLLMSSSGLGEDESPGGQRPPPEVFSALSKAAAYAGPGEMARALLSLPAGCLGNETDVSDVVKMLLGALLDTRRHTDMPPRMTGDLPGLDDETACFNPATLMHGRATMSSKGSEGENFYFSSGERPIYSAERYRHEPALEEQDEDDQEVTTTFRPSSIPRLIARRKQEKPQQAKGLSSDEATPEAKDELCLPPQRSNAPQPSVSQPGAPQPSALQPSALQPSALQPSALQRSVPQRSAPQPSAQRRSAPQPSVPQPAVSQPSVSQPSVPQRGTPGERPPVVEPSVPTDGILTESDLLDEDDADALDVEVDVHELTRFPGDLDLDPTTIYVPDEGSITRQVYRARNRQRRVVFWVVGVVAVLVLSLFALR